MQELYINRENGNIAKLLPGEDHISGLIWVAERGAFPEVDGYQIDIPQTEPFLLTNISDAENWLGIRSNAVPWINRTLHYHISEFFRINPAGRLWVEGILMDNYDDIHLAIDDTLKNLQIKASGKIRQMGVWLPNVEMADEALVSTARNAAEEMHEYGMPFIVVLAPQVRNIYDLPYDMTDEMFSRVSVLVGQDGGGKGAALHIAIDEMEYDEDAGIERLKAQGNPGGSYDTLYSVTAIGTVMGIISKAAVHQSIAWVKAFPTGISVPAFSDGTLYYRSNHMLIDQLEMGRYLYLQTHVGIAGSFLNDSHNMDKISSDYAYIENVRTMDKAERGIRTNLTPELGGNVYVDPETGFMKPYTVKNLETVANRAIEDMEKAGELSGYKVEVDPEQDVLSTGIITVVVKNVPVGVARYIRVKIGFYKTV